MAAAVAAFTCGKSVLSI